jgi:hypothetical protein
MIKGLYIFADLIKKDEMGRACGAHGKREMHMQFLSKIRREGPLGRPKRICVYFLWVI